EGRGRQRDQRASEFAAERIQQQEDQRVLEEIVAEGGEELAPEQGREASLQQQRSGHSSFSPFARGTGFAHARAGMASPFAAARCRLPSVRKPFPAVVSCQAQRLASKCHAVGCRVATLAASST